MGGTCTAVISSISMTVCWHETVYKLPTIGSNGQSRAPSKGHWSKKSGIVTTIPILDSILPDSVMDLPKPNVHVLSTQVPLSDRTKHLKNAF